MQLRAVPPKTVTLSTVTETDTPGLRHAQRADSGPLSEAVHHPSSIIHHPPSPNGICLTEISDDHTEQDPS